MKIKNQLAVLTTLAAFTLTACNSNSGDKQIGVMALTDEIVSTLNQQINTQFLDSPVKGLNVVAEDGKTKTLTGSGGAFSCLTGQLVDFKLGNLSLGKGACSDRIFISEIVNGNFDKAVGLGSLLQTLGGDDEVELDVSEYKEKDLSALQDDVDEYIKGDGSIESYEKLLTAFKDADLPGFEEAVANPQATFDKSKEHINKTISQYATNPGWAAASSGDVSFNGTLVLDAENSTAEDCAQTANVSSAIEFDSAINHYTYRYQVIEDHIQADGTTKKVLHSSDGEVVNVTSADQKPDYTKADKSKALVLTGDSLTSSYTAKYDGKAINFLNSLNFEGEDINTLTMKGTIGNMLYTPSEVEGEEAKVLGCLYKASIAGAAVSTEAPPEPTPTPEEPTPTPSPTPTPEPAPEA